MFEIKDLTVKAGDKVIIDGINLKLGKGELHAIMGPNGAGKSTLANALMGHPNLKVTGTILINGEDISNLTPDARARKGLFLAFQAPQEIEGVSIFNFMRKATNANEEKGKPSKELLERLVKLKAEADSGVEKVGLPKEILKRDLNVGLSGGEKKRVELLQMIMLKPKIVVLDEIDSGLDIDSLKSVANAITEMNDGTRCFLVITHYKRILEYIKPDFVHVLSKGKIIKTGGHDLAQELEQKGYAGII